MFLARGFIFSRDEVFISEGRIFTSDKLAFIFV